MDDNWDDDETPSASNQGGPGSAFASSGGQTFGRGRGFSQKTVDVKLVGASSNHDNDWGSSFGKSQSNVKDFGNNNSVGDSCDNTYGEGGWSDKQFEDEGSERSYRGRGGGRSRNPRGSRGGGRGGNTQRNNYFNNDDNSSWGNNEENNGAGGDGGWQNSDDTNGNNFRGRGRGRGRGGRGGGRGGERNTDDREDSENPNPPEREIYIPPEPTTDENELFGSGISTGSNFTKYDDIEVEVSGENVPKPITSFENSGLRPIILDNIKKSNYLRPTPIQKNSIPVIIGGRDLMACAQTGSGKTAAFLLPIIHCLLEDPQDIVFDEEHAEPQAIIVSPTRELAIQIFNEARKFSFGSCIKVVLTYGGTSVGYQRKNVLRGCHMLITTPGRMDDFVRRGAISFASTRFVVLDEADRMLDMGFLNNIREMLEHATMTPTGERRTLMFSATFPEDIQRLAAQFLDNYIFIAVGIVGGACSDVEQVIYDVERFDKRQKLIEILKEEGDKKTLIFVETKRSVDFTAVFLNENNFESTCIHGDRLQRQREEAITDFKRGRRNILVATAVAARGLDIDNVKHVINYDLPKDIDEYVHRIGRTGRLGNRGKATSFFDKSRDCEIAGNLAKILKQAGQPVPDWLDKYKSGSYTKSAFGGRDVRENDSLQPQNCETFDEDWN